MTDPSETTVERFVRERGPVELGASPLQDYTSFPKMVKTVKSLCYEVHPKVKVLYPPTSQLSSENSFSPTLAHEAVLYCDKHDAREVVELWLDINPQILDRASAWAVYRNLRDKKVEDRIVEAAKPVLKERDPEGWRGRRAEGWG